MENHEKIWNTWKYNCNKKIAYKYKYLVKYRRYRAYISFYLMSQTRWQPCTHPIPFCCTSCHRTMHTNWSTMSIKTPNLKYFPSEPNSYLNKQSTKKGTVIQLYVLSHEDQFTSSTSMAAFFTCTLALSCTKMLVMSVVKVKGTITLDTSWAIIRWYFYKFSFADLRKTCWFRLFRGVVHGRCGWHQSTKKGWTLKVDFNEDKKTK